VEYTMPPRFFVPMVNHFASKKTDFQTNLQWIIRYSFFNLDFFQKLAKGNE